MRYYLFAAAIMNMFSLWLLYTAHTSYKATAMMNVGAIHGFWLPAGLVVAAIGVTWLSAIAIMIGWIARGR